MERFVIVGVLLCVLFVSCSVPEEQPVVTDNCSEPLDYSGDFEIVVSSHGGWGGHRTVHVFSNGSAYGDYDGWNITSRWPRTGPEERTITYYGANWSKELNESYLAGLVEKLEQVDFHCLKKYDSCAACDSVDAGGISFSVSAGQSAEVYIDRGCHQSPQCMLVGTLADQMTDQLTDRSNETVMVVVR